MEFFLSLSNEHGPDSDPVRSLDGHVRQAQAAERAGFRGLVTGQHISTSGMQWIPPYQLLSYIAPYCSGMTLGTTVAIVPFTHPVLLAEAAAALDAMAGGGTILGLGGGWNQTEFDSLGITRAAGARKVREAAEIIRRLWGGTAVTYHGDFYSLDDVKLALRPAGPVPPPIWAGGSNERTVRLLAGSCDALVYSAHLSVPDLKNLQEAFLGERDRIGSPPPTDTPIIRNVFVGADHDAAVAACMPYVAASYAQYGNAGLFRDVVAKAGDDPLRVAHDLGERLVVGSADEVASELGRICELFGATKVITRMQWYGMPTELVEESIMRFGRDVIPQLALVGGASQGASA
jgi:alkanesulfonate monooxygenase SsuD/methylene tetrahydromethanopterin reductase-like flavin-dependent oxidoreductase (luciferase family)